MKIIKLDEHISNLIEAQQLIFNINKSIESNINSDIHKELFNIQKNINHVRQLIISEHNK